MRLARWIVIATLAVSSVSAQSVYEAASVKLNNSGGTSSSSHGSKGQIVFTNVNLKRLLERAYDVKPIQVKGPAWMEDVRVDIAAKYPKDTKGEDQAAMLRSLLEERFKLVAHRTSQDLPGYALVVAKGGFKLKPVEDVGGSDTSSNTKNHVRTLTVKTTPMDRLADILTRSLGEMVVDQTGLEGVYNFELTWAADENQKPDDAALDTGPSLFTALQETLGLRLKPEKVPVEIIVVDHLERVPVEN
jgi:uncharacterized protein (TIGR03435 family)